MFDGSNGDEMGMEDASKLGNHGDGSRIVHVPKSDQRTCGPQTNLKFRSMPNIPQIY